VGTPQEKDSKSIPLTRQDPNCDTTFIEPPDTPAPQFAVKAFKQALFGTPAPPERSPAKKIEKKTKSEAPNSTNTVLPPPKENALSTSPSKQPGGILMTPGTASKGRKTVSFGAHVVDNEGKRGGTGRSGIPNDCPGKFPSPWTPGTELQKVDPASDTRPRTKLTAALYNARSTGQSGQKPKAKDDADITMDMGTPRSESGKYWKEQYETYAERSQKEVKKLLVKQQIAKNYAKKKDTEAMEAVTRLAEERKRFRSRERRLEQQNKDFQERLRQAMADNSTASIEIAALKNRIAALEKSLVVTSSDIQNTKMSFQIFEDPNRDSSNLCLEQGNIPEARDTIDPPSILVGKQVNASRLLVEGKENSPPKLRHRRRQTVADTSSRSMLQSTSPVNALEQTENPPEKYQISEPPPKSPLRARLPQPNKENIPAAPKSPVAALPSSPLPQPSPDPWLQQDSPIQAVDRMALPISSGMGYSRPPKPTYARHRVSKSVAPASKAAPRRPEPHASKSEGINALSQIESSKNVNLESQDVRGELHKANTAAVDKPAASEKKVEATKNVQQTGESSTMLKSRAAALSQDRREKAQRRLQERMKAKKMGAGA
jgi:hypothetical protein